MKLELKHLAPYLPYELKVFLDGVRETFKVDASGDKYHINEVTVKDVLTKPLKPILRPLSDMAKEKFSFKDEIQWKGSVLFLLMAIKDKNQEDILNSNYQLLVQLFENHFDVFGLIPEGLAIDANTIK